MTTDLIFWTQIASILVFVGTLFGLYGVLVSQKDATIELLREQIAHLKSQSPDALLESVAKRYKLAVEEIERRDVDEAERRKLGAQALQKARLEGQLELQRVVDAQFAALLKGRLSSDRTYTTR